MTQRAEVSWSDTEKTIAVAAIKKAYSREIDILVKEIRDNARFIDRAEDLWRLHDFLSSKRHDIDGKYDEREAFLVYTLSRLVKDGWLELAELEELSQEKRAKINLLTRM